MSWYEILAVLGLGVLGWIVWGNIWGSLIGIVMLGVILYLAARHGPYYLEKRLWYMRRRKIHSVEPGEVSPRVMSSIKYVNKKKQSR